MKYPVLYALPATLVVIGLLGLATYRTAPMRPPASRIVLAPAPDPIEELEEALAMLDRARAIDEYPGWLEFPRHPVTGQIMDPLFDCPGMEGPPPTDWNTD